MKPISLKSKYALALVIAGLLAGGPVFADKGGKGGGKHDRSDDRQEQRDDRKGDRRDNDDRSHGSGKRDHFKDQNRVAVRDYYTNEYKGKRCPPGLAKKNNGCMPPGQAKKWQMGRVLPREVVYYEVPQPLVTQIGTPPSGYKYVRVAGDILMIATGTRMVVDAIQNLGR